MTETHTLPSVGDEVMEGKTRAIVTDIRGGVVWLRRPHGGGGAEWPAEDPRKLTVRRTRAEMIEGGEL
ncbi:hypothetical protein ACFU93_21370 [Streptomyces sp. NPDC057611]|uniref:hypothetical protein n=1 Tax=Streptomyces sp. NPDC057611 TaxID=3346182 RepID=UPI00369D61B9